MGNFAQLIDTHVGWCVQSILVSTEVNVKCNDWPGTLSSAETDSQPGVTQIVSFKIEWFPM